AVPLQAAQGDPFPAQPAAQQHGQGAAPGAARRQLDARPGMTEITRHFAYTQDGRRIHYRRAGSGPPLVLLHASPSSSRVQIPLLRAWADDFTVIALDTPGFGLSDPLPGGRV